MSLLRATSPHTHSATHTQTVMLWVIAATLPGFLVLNYYFGWGVTINVLLACSTSALCEALVLRLRRRPVWFYLKDCSALVTAVLLALALPPYAPWWLVVIGSATAIVLAKQLYGGLGYNPFNPAMVAYVVLLISFPVEMTRWALPQSLLEVGASLPSLWDALQWVFVGHDTLVNGVSVDVYTGATPLDAFKNEQGLLVEQIYQQQVIFAQGVLAGVGWEWVNAAFLLGGVVLLYKKIYTWHAPLSMLVALGIMSVLFYDGGSSESGGTLWMHWFSGGTMLGAFFILTDPVSSAVSNRGRIIFGASIGVLVYIIRVWGNYPDAIAFAILLMNFAAPFIDYYTVPRTYGHEKSKPANRSQS